MTLTRRTPSPWDAYPEWLRMLVCAACLLGHGDSRCQHYLACFLCGATRRCICCAPPAVGAQRCCERLSTLYARGAYPTEAGA